MKYKNPKAIFTKPKKNRYGLLRPRFVRGAILPYKCGENIVINDGLIDMGFNTGVSLGIYRNVFIDRSKILNAKHRLDKRIFEKIR